MDRWGVLSIQKLVFFIGLRRNVLCYFFVISYVNISATITKDIQDILIR